MDIKDPAMLDFYKHTYNLPLALGDQEPEHAIPLIEAMLRQIPARLPSRYRVLKINVSGDPEVNVKP